MELVAGYDMMEKEVFRPYRRGSSFELEEVICCRHIGHCSLALGEEAEAGDDHLTVKVNKVVQVPKHCQLPTWLGLVIKRVENKKN